jgi:hypothetical protein
MPENGVVAGGYINAMHREPNSASYRRLMDDRFVADILAPTMR